MSHRLNEKEKNFILQKVKEIKEASGISYGFGGDKHIVEQVTDSYIKQREKLILSKGVEPESQHAVDKMARYEAAARGYNVNREREDREARLNQKISEALSGPKVGFGDIKRITADTTAEFEEEERFGKMKF